MSNYSISLLSDDETLSSRVSPRSFIEKSPRTYKVLRPEKINTETLSPYSQAHSKVIRSDSASPTINLKSSFSQNPKFTELQKTKWQNKSAKNLRSPTHARQSILKAAIFRNIAMQSEFEEDDESSPIKSPRQFSSDKIGLDLQIPIFSRSWEGASKRLTNDNESDDGGDVGDENSNVSSDYERFVTNSPKIKTNQDSFQVEMISCRFSDFKQDSEKGQ